MNPPASGYVPPVAPNPNNGVYVVSPSDLMRGAADGSVTIVAKGDVSEIQLPPQAAGLTDGAELTVQLDALGVTIPSAVLKQLAALVTADELKQGTIVLKAEALSAEQAKALLDKAKQSGGSADMTALSGIYAFSLGVKKADGTLIALKAFGKPVRIAIAAKTPTDDSLAGVYAIGEDGRLGYRADAMRAASLRRTCRTSARTRHLKSRHPSKTCRPAIGRPRRLPNLRRSSWCRARGKGCSSRRKP